jgi:hypothetical protein
MPPLPSPGNVLQCSFATDTAASINAGSRFFLSYTGGPPNSTDLNTLAGDIASGWNTNIAPWVHPNDSLVAATVTDLSSDTGAVGSWTGSHAGSLSPGDQLPAQIAACLNHKISRRYRGGRPRIFLRCGTDHYLSGTNEWTDDFITDIDGAWHTFITALVATSGLSITLTDIVNVSYYQGFLAFEEPSGRYRNIPQKRTTPKVDGITLTTCAKKLGTQRRRADI